MPPGTSLAETYKAVAVPSSTSVRALQFSESGVAKDSRVFSLHDKGKLLWACGLGKALLGVWVAQRMNCRSIVIGVPSVFLQKQMKKEILKVFPSTKRILGVGGGNGTTDPKRVREFLAQDVGGPLFVITTYHSCHVLSGLEHNFDLKIGDEAHHLVGLKDDNNDNVFCSFHQISSTKSLFMTATEKIAPAPIPNGRMTHFSMDDESVFVGQRPHHKVLRHKGRA